MTEATKTMILLCDLLVIIALSIAACYVSAIIGDLLVPECIASSQGFGYCGSLLLLGGVSGVSVFAGGLVLYFRHSWRNSPLLLRYCKLLRMAVITILVVLTVFLFLDGAPWHIGKHECRIPYNQRL